MMGYPGWTRRAEEPRRPLAPPRARLRPRLPGAQGALSRELPRLLLVAPEPAPHARGLLRRLRGHLPRTEPVDEPVRAFPLHGASPVELAPGRAPRAAASG